MMIDAKLSGSVGAGSGWTRLGPVVSAVLAICVYACTLRGTYVYDDVLVAQRDPRLSNPKLWGQYWTRPYADGPDKPYRPLVSMSFAIQRWLHGDRPWALHLVNILLHAGVAAAVAVLGRRLADARAGMVAGILFAVHPAHVEAVAGLVGRAELLCALCLLGAILLFLGGPLTGRRVAAIAACALAAMLSKEQGLLLPLMLLAAAPLRQRAVIQSEGRAHRLALIATLCYLLCGYILLREYTVGFWWDRRFLEWVVNPMVRSRGIDRTLMPLVLLGRYFALLVVPMRLSIDYGGYAIGFTASWRDPYLYLGAITLAGWVALLVRSIRARDAAMVFCLAALAMVYGMIGNIIALLPTIFAERLMYIPSAFFLLIVAMLVRRLPPRVLAPLVLAPALAGAIETFRYARLWNDPMALFRQCVADQPRSERVYAQLFREYALRGDWRSARRVAGQCVAQIPDADQGYGMCAAADLQLGDLADARAIVDRGLSACRPDDRYYLLMWREKIDQAGRRPG